MEHKDVQGLKLVLGVYILVFALKLAAYLITGVMAVLAEALHTLSDIFISAFLLAATIWSRRAADREHMFGHGRAQNVAALVAATLFISFTSYKLYEEAIPRLFKAHEASYQNIPLALGTLAISMVIAAAPLVKLVRQKERGAAVKAQLAELVNDELGLLAALIGTLLVMGGKPVADPLAAIVVATIIAVNAAGLFRENLSYLVGRAPDAQKLAEIERTAHSVPGVIGVHDLKAELTGPDTIHADMHIKVRRGMPVEEAALIAEQVRVTLQQRSSCRYCTVHVDAARDGNQAGPEHR